jgi:hypothetical protein
MNLSRDTLIDWLESLREYNDAQLHGSAIKLTRRVAIRAENDALGLTIRALVDGEECAVDSVPKQTLSKTLYEEMSE